MIEAFTPSVQYTAKPQTTEGEDVTFPPVGDERQKKIYVDGVSTRIATHRMHSVPLISAPAGAFERWSGAT